MAAKTYAECEREIDDRVDRVTNEYEETANQDLFNRYAFQLGVAKSIAAQMMFENEKLRDQSNTAEMHQLLERLKGIP